MTQCFDTSPLLSLPPANVIGLQRLKNVNKDMMVHLNMIVSMNLIGDEYHYLFECNFFADQRKELLKQYFFRRPNTVKYAELFGSAKKSILLKLAKFVKVIMKSM